MQKVGLLFQKEWDIPVYLGNDANCAVIGEYHAGAAKGAESVLMVTLGTGIGGGFVYKGKLFEGRYHGAMEIGHMIIEKNGKRCSCGNHGCFEQYASATGIVRLANRRLAKDDAPSVLRSGEVSAKTVWDAVKAGDALAVQVAEQFGEYLGKALGVIAGIVNPEIIVIGGGVSKAGEILFDYIRPYFEKTVFSGCKDARLALATLGNDAGIFGAAKLMME